MEQRILKKPEKTPIVTWVVEVPATGKFFALVQATNAVEARELARDADDWFTMDDIEPDEVQPTSKAFVDSGHYQRAADQARADEASEDEGAEDEIESDETRDVPRG